MKKTKFITSGAVLVVILASLVGLSALAQNTAPAAPIGPGNTGTIGPAQGAPAAPTKKMLDDALSPQTRDTLQDAINSVDPAALTVKQLDIGPGEGAELDGTKIDPVEFTRLPGSAPFCPGRKCPPNADRQYGALNPVCRSWSGFICRRLAPDTRCR